MPDTAWKTKRGRILYGVLGEERDGLPGLYEVTSTCGRYVTQAICLSSEATRDGFGDYSKPEPGTMCVCLLTDDGNQAVIVGFHALPFFDEEKSDAPTFRTAEEVQTPGDRVMKTRGGSRIQMKLGGLTCIEGGPGAAVQMSPVNDFVTIRSGNCAMSADGYKAFRGRSDLKSTSPSTRHEEKWDSAVGVSFDRIEETKGAVGDDVRCERSLKSVTIAANRETTATSYVDRVRSDGRWESKGPEYKWGDGSQAMVLGNALVDALGTLIDIISKIQHGTAVGPTTPPLPQYIQELVDLKLQLSDTILSTFMSLSKDPAIP